MEIYRIKIKRIFLCRDMNVTQIIYQEIDRTTKLFTKRKMSNLQFQIFDLSDFGLYTFTVK
jgi:hypothetical protein